MLTTIDSKNTVSIVTGYEESPDSIADSELSVFVVFTSNDWTLRALEKAREIAKPLGANIVVVALQVVPFPLPLSEPPVSMEFVIRRFEENSNEFPDGTQVAAYLCRNPLEALKRILPLHCPVVMGVRKRWLPSRDEKMARMLRRAGYRLTLIKAE
jgi:hypothetical protein